MQYTLNFSDEISPFFLEEQTADPIPHDPSYPSYTQDELDELNSPFQGREWSDLNSSEQLELFDYWCIECDPVMRNMDMDREYASMAAAEVRHELEELSPFDCEAEWRMERQEMADAGQARIQARRALKPLVVGNQFNCLAGDVVLDKLRDLFRS